MPVYEFYCSTCHTIYNFLSRRVNTSKRPPCPQCGKPELERQVSRFAFSRGQQDEPGSEIPELDEAKLEKAMLSLAGELDGMDENDPRQMARMMRRLTDAAGVSLGSGMEEAISRLEAGEDPEKVEEEMAPLLDENSLFSKEGVRGLKKKLAAPSRDETLYVLE